MNDKKTYLMFLNWIILVLVCINSTNAEGLRMPELSVSLFKSRLIIGEPLIVSVKVENTSSESIPSAFSGTEDFSNSTSVIFRIFSSNGSVVCEEPITTASVDRIRLINNNPELKPNQSFHFERTFVPRSSLRQNNQTQDELLSAGRYEMECTLSWSPYANETVPLVSDKIELQIVEPTGIDVEAVKLLTSSELDTFFTGRHGGRPLAITTLIAKYPESTYAKYAQLRLFLDQANHMRDTGKMDVQKNEIEDLISFGMNSVEKDNKMPLNDDILLGCARMTKALNREEEAIKIFERIVKEYPQSNSAEIAQKRLTAYKTSPDQMKDADQVTQSPRKKPLGNVLPIAGASVAVVVIAGVVMFLRTKKLKKAE
jgi:hypothetical protein